MADLVCQGLALALALLRTGFVAHLACQGLALGPCPIRDIGAEQFLGNHTDIKT